LGLNPPQALQAYATLTLLISCFPYDPYNTITTARQKTWRGHPKKLALQPLINNIP
jgi:hypothetical protein